MESTIYNFHGEHRFLSNFYPVFVEWEGLSYSSVEHAYQASKTLEYERRAMVCRTITPGAAKRLGSLLKLRDDWEDIKIDVMRELLKLKFSTINSTLLAGLRYTAPRPLVEGNNWGDRFWGQVWEPRKGWVGENHLGKLLMEIRDNDRS